MFFMTTCPNCERKISAEDTICPNCHFNVQKYRDLFFADAPREPQNKENQEAERIVTRREDYRQEFYPKKQNIIVARMLDWIRANSMIVLLLGILLLLIMSFSRSIGWICFFALFIWLYVVCVRTDKIERYTVDKRLTEKVNQLGSNMFNNVDESKEKVKSKRKGKEPSKGERRVEEEVATVKKHFNYTQLLVILMAIINLIVLFTGSGASVSDISYTGKMSITRVLFGLAGRLFSSSSTLVPGIEVCVIWLLIFLFPIVITYNTLKDTKKNCNIAFALSIIESLFLVYLIFRLSNTTLSNTGFLKNITSQLLLYAVSIGASTYFLILSSIMTTILLGYNLYKKYKQK